MLTILAYTGTAQDQGFLPRNLQSFLGRESHPHFLRQVSRLLNHCP
jgi:hypothetical protein